MGLLTQLIGPSKLSHSKTRKNKHKDRTCQRELERLHTKYLADTEVIDRATGHLESLEKATSRVRTPTKMAINIKPLVLNRDNEQFKTEWQAAIAESEKKLMKTVTDHLKRVICYLQNKCSMNSLYLRINVGTCKWIMHIDFTLQFTLQFFSQSRILPYNFTHENGEPQKIFKNHILQRVSFVHVFHLGFMHLTTHTL